MVLLNPDGTRNFYTSSTDNGNIVQSKCHESQAFSLTSAMRVVDYLALSQTMLNMKFVLHGYLA